MIKKIVLIGTVFLAISCSRKEGAYYFNFDQVDHYSIEIDESTLFDLEEKTNLSRNEQLKVDLIVNYKPESIEDTLFVPKLEQFGFTKQKVPDEKFAALKELFREKSHKEVYHLLCIHVYRDVLIFKRNDSIIGMAKICFECLDSQIVGTTANTSEFGQSGDYGKLRKLLKN